MYISTKTGYALRALAQLAANDEKAPLSLAELVKDQPLPIKYLEHLFRNLKKAELVLSKKGSRGGYYLAKSPEEISLQDIMTAVEESQHSFYCRDNKIDADYCQGANCGFRKLWHRIGDDMEKYFSNITLAEVIKNYI